NTAGAAGLLSTATDLQKWNAFWKNKGFGDTVSKLREQQGVLNSGRKINYALGGVNVFERDGLKLITHGGLLTAYRTLTSYYPDLDLSITYCANTREIIAPELVKKILEIRSDTVSKLREQQGVLNSGRKINYALGGVNVFERDGLKLITHGGLLTAYRTLTSYYPDLDLSITYCANTREIIAPELVKKILEI